MQSNTESQWTIEALASGSFYALISTQSRSLVDSVSSEAA